MRKGTFSFDKKERIVSRKLIETLFDGGQSHSVAAFPLRSVYMTYEHQDGHQPVEVLISVPKKKLHHAVDRNRVKRQVREAYRHHKHLLIEKVPPTQTVAIAFIWLTDRTVPSSVLESRMKNVLERIGKRIEN